MSLFLLTFFLLYGGVHAYSLLKARTAFGLSQQTTVALIFWMAMMVVAPFLARLAEEHNLEQPARALAYVGYTWMGVLFLFFSAAIVIDFYHITIFIAAKALRRDYSVFALSATTSFYVPLMLAATISFYGYCEARNIRTERLRITTPKLPGTLKKLVIVQISDLHLGLLVGQSRLVKVIEKITAENPDVVVSTGDLVDGQLDGLASLVQLLQEVKPRYGKYAVTGNHEFYAGLPQALSFTEQAGFRLLRQESLTVADLLTIAGVDDPAAGRFVRNRTITEKELLSATPKDQFTLLLKHRPVIEPASLGLFDLQLSGHVHKGQIFPFNLLTHLFYPVKMGFAAYPHNSTLYVSRGTGTWGPPIRFLAPPEITVIELIPG